MWARADAWKFPLKEKDEGKEDSTVPAAASESESDHKEGENTLEDGEEEAPAAPAPVFSRQLGGLETAAARRRHEADTTAQHNFFRG